MKSVKILSCSNRFKKNRYRHENQREKQQHMWKSAWLEDLCLYRLWYLLTHSLLSVLLCLELTLSNFTFEFSSLFICWIWNFYDFVWETLALFFFFLLSQSLSPTCKSYRKTGSCTKSALFLYSLCIFPLAISMMNQNVWHF